MAAFPFRNHLLGRTRDALDIIDRALAEARTENAVLNDSGLAVEIDLLKKLRTNVEKQQTVKLIMTEPVSPDGASHSPRCQPTRAHGYKYTVLLPKAP